MLHYKLLQTGYCYIFFFLWIIYLNSEYGLKYLRSQFTWLILFALLAQFGVKIFVITSFKDTCSIEILPQVQKSNRSKIPILNSFQQSGTFDHSSSVFFLIEGLMSTLSCAVIFLSFWAEVHYNSIYPEGGNFFFLILKQKHHFFFPLADSCSFVETIPCYENLQLKE